MDAPASDDGLTLAIHLSPDGRLQIQGPENKIAALGLLSMAAHIIAGQTSGPQSMIAVPTLRLRQNGTPP